MPLDSFNEHNPEAEDFNTKFWDFVDRLEGQSVEVLDAIIDSKLHCDAEVAAASHLKHEAEKNRGWDPDKVPQTVKEQ